MAERAGEPIVLVVDDEPGIRELFGRILAFGGYLTIDACSGHEALDLLDAGLRPDAVLLDLIMPGMDGLELLAHVRAQPRYAGIPIAIVTGATFMPESSVDAAAALDAEIQFKPLAMEDILDLADRLVAQGNGSPC